MVVSSAVRVFAKTYPDKRLIQLDHPTSLSILAGVDSPAVSFSATFAPETMPPDDLNSVLVYNGIFLIFTGYIDLQKATVDKNGITLRIEARDSGATLLDNELQPCPLVGVTLNSMIKLYLEPRGFTAYYTRNACWIHQFDVRAGMSNWDVIRQYSERVYGCTPYVVGKQVFFQRKTSDKKLVVSNSHDGEWFTSLTKNRVPYNMISRMYVRDELGNYPINVGNPVAHAAGFARIRFITPTTEYDNFLALDAQKRLTRSNYNSENYVVVFPKILDIDIGSDVTINDDLLQKSGLMVSEREYIIDDGGESTKLTLGIAKYFE